MRINKPKINKKAQERNQIKVGLLVILGRLIEQKESRLRLTAVNVPAVVNQNG